MRALLILLALLLAQPAAALELLPTTLQLPAEGGRAELWLHNPGPGRWQGQVQVLAWDQQLDAERLHPSDQVRVSPARLDLAPGGTQRVWLLPGDPTAAIGEQAYRIVLAPALSGLPRYSLPLFRGPEGPALQPRLQGHVEALGSQTMLRLSNPDTLHSRLHDLRFITADGQSSLLLGGLAGYVLAGHERRWPLPARADGYAGGHFQARLQDGREVDLTASDPAIAASAPSGL
ncbi:MAG TPA: pilus assembly protein [Stenotrophomonas sp.]|jgi:fimbrial chaperone protein|nr:pilus assembly protein [Stenotrophomonas sp.]